jgi:hypothetical protein
MRRTLLFLPVALAVAACGGTMHAASTHAATTAAPKRLHVAIHGQDHHPLVGKRWHFEVRVTDAATGKPMACRIHLQFFFSGTPVGEVGVHVVKNGFWQEIFGAPGNPAFPPAARGQPLVLRATVTAKGYATARAGWSIVPR